jgi:hypothetical protein
MHKGYDLEGNDLYLKLGGGNKPKSNNMAWKNVDE